MWEEGRTKRRGAVNVREGGCHGREETPKVKKALEEKSIKM